MRNIGLFLSVCLLLISFSLTAQKASVKRAQKKFSPTNTLRVMSYNIRYANPKDSINYWPNRQHKVSGLIRYHQPDIFGVQEALVGQLQDLEKALPEFTWYGVGRNDGKESGEFSAIYYRKDRFKLLDKGTFWLSLEPNKPGSKDWDAAITRICTWAKFQDLKSRKTFYHFNTHYDHQGKIAREKSSEVLLTQMEKIAGKAPVVLTGDFNVPITSKAYTTLVNNTSLKDAQFITEKPHYGPHGSFAGFAVKNQLQPKIDFIFVKTPIRVLQHAVLTDQQDGYYPSDHLPVLAEIQIL